MVKMERIESTNKKYRVVSLFSGIGGIDLGFEFAGFNCIWANDFDKYACQTYRANVGDHIVEGDIRLVKDQIPEHDVLVGGFPCQPFSTLGKLQGFDDEKNRGTLFFEIMDIITKHDTKVVILENVKNLVNHDEGRTFERIKKELADAGYYVNAHILNTQDYGVPQRRNRVFIVAFNKKYFDEAEFFYPEKEELTVTTQDLLDEVVTEKYFLTKKLEKTILGMGTKGYIVKPTIDLPISKTLTATMHKMHRASQDNYVTDLKNFNENVEDKDNRIPVRKLTPNECRKLQGFPSEWKQVVSDTQAYKQFGNAVTVDVAYKLAVNVLEYMDANLKE
jgi:DNA (cytosine-5)-methyltransferase 1